MDSQVPERWSTFFQGNNRATPFSRPEWLWPSGELGTSNPFLLDLDCGYAPLYLKTRNTTKTIRCRGADYEDIVAQPGHELEAVKNLLKQLKERSNQWDICDFRTLLPESVMMSVFGAEGSSQKSELADLLRGTTLAVMPHHIYHCVDIPSNWQEYEAHIGKNMAYQVRSADARRKKQFKESILRISTEETLDQDLEALYRLHTERWQAKGQSGFFPDERSRTDFSKRCHGLLKAGQLRLYSLWLDGEPAAAVANFVDARRIYYYGTGFDPKFGKNYPMKVLIAQAIKDGMEGWPKEFDFMKGEEEYKFKWSNSLKTTSRLVIARNTAPGLSALAVLKLQSRFKEWKNRRAKPTEG